MPNRIIIPHASGSSNNDIRMAASGDLIGPALIKEEPMACVIGVMKYLHMFQAHDLTDSEREFQEQKKLFELIPPLLLRQWEGRFVASRNGEIVDSDEDMDCLIDRFFTTHGEVAVYITRIGAAIREFIDTPFSG